MTITLCSVKLLTTYANVATNAAISVYGICVLT